jgi:hypothetical protein
MDEIIATLKKHPNTWYNLADLQRMRAMPWATNGRTLRKILDADKKGPDMLQSVVTGDGAGRRYTVQGRALIKYLQTYGPGLMALVNNSKRVYGNKQQSERKHTHTKVASTGVSKRARY